MGDELKSKLDIFVTNMTKKIEKKELFPEIQQEYDEVIEFFDKLTILTNEEFEDLEKAINKYESTVKKNEEQINSLLLRIKSDDEKIKSLQDDLSKNSNLEEQYKKLNEEYNKLKQKMDTENNEISNYQIKIKNNEKIIGDLQNEINKVKKEIFEKKIKITEYERDKKQNEILKNENNEKINKLINEKNELSKSNVELRNINTETQKSYENKIKILEKQLKHLSDANNNFVVENNEVQNQLKDFQMYTNMAKVNAKKLNKEDFSILEVMSKRAETAEMEVQKLLSYIEELKSLNIQIRNKIKPLEDYALLQIKHDHEISIANDTILDIQNRIFTDEERKEIFKLKNEPNELFQTLIKLKTENLELHKHIKDITIECNQQLREARWKNK
jgi:chromosome segregation ATPase